MAYKLVDPKEIPKHNIKNITEDGLLEVFKLATAMSVLCVKERGIGLSATQIGIPLSLFIVKNNFHTEDYMNGFAFYVNCKYEPVDEEIYESLEGCLSLKDKHGNLRYFVVNRPASIRVVGKKLLPTNPLRLEDVDVIITKEHGSSVFAHEIDHCFGKLISDTGTEFSVKKAKKYAK